MKLYLACALLILAQSILSEKIVNNNKDLDELIASMNWFNFSITDNIVPSLKFGPFIGTNVSVASATLYRTGDATSLDVANTSSSIDIHIGMRLLALDCKELKIGEDHLRAVVVVRNNSLHASSTKYNTPCRFEFNFELESFSALVYGSLPEYNGKDISDAILPYVNSELRKGEIILKAMFENLICHGNYSSFNNSLFKRFPENFVYAFLNKMLFHPFYPRHLQAY